MIQQVIKDDTVYINARYIAGQYRYAPSLLRELYEKSEVPGKFFEGTLFFEKKAWERYYQNERQSQPATTEKATTKEHFYTHRARARQSRYEPDDDDLMPPVHKAKTTATAEDDAPAARPARIPVELADATKVKVHTTNTNHISYLPTERPHWVMKGNLVVEEVYTETDTDTDSTKAVHTDTTSKVAPIANEHAESTPASTPTTTPVAPQTTSTEADTTAQSATKTPPVDTVSESRAWFVTVTVSAAALLLAVTVGALLEQHVIANSDGVTSSWHLSLQSAIGWWEHR